MKIEVQKYKIRRLDIYLLLFLIVIFLINYHYYRYYEKDFKQISQYVELDLRKNQYNEVQKQNRYYEVYKLAEETKKNKQQVIFLFNHRNKDTYDYSSTYFFNKDITDPEQYEIKHLSELGAVINYFFYPRIIKNYDLKEYLLYKPEIISDYSAAIPFEIFGYELIRAHI